MNANHQNKLAGFCSVLCLLALLPAHAHAQVPAILIEACSLLEPTSKRVECLKVANKQTAAEVSNSYSPQPVYSAAPNGVAPRSLNAASAPRPSYSALGGQTCFVGPRGGTYTITKSGKKNYGGC